MRWTHMVADVIARRYCVKSRRDKLPVAAAERKTLTDSSIYNI